jgi:putative hydrolase of the HAD superfamily
VIFDFGGVLTFQPTDQDWQALAEVVGAPLSSFHEQYWSTRNDYDIGRMDGATYWRSLAGTFERELTDGHVGQLAGIDNQQWGRENSNAIAVVRAVHAAGLKIAVLSNMHADMLSDVRKEFSWLSEFDVQVFSCELDIAKPSPEVFLHTARLLGVRPEESLFVDDLPSNIDGAAHTGMKTMLFDSAESCTRLQQLLRALAS